LTFCCQAPGSIGLYLEPIFNQDKRFHFGSTLASRSALEDHRVRATITTFTGRQFDIFSPRIADIDICDIAHATSNLCRFTGHARHFYSVAQHCVLVSQLVPIGLEQYGLLHDAAEAYVNDLSTPIKHHEEMRFYRNIEARIETMIFARFGLQDLPRPEVKAADRHALQLERTVLFGNSTAIKPLPPAAAEKLFLDRFEELFRSHTNPIPIWVGEQLGADAIRL
jgi:hypothetical protein